MKRAAILALSCLAGCTTVGGRASCDRADGGHPDALGPVAPLCTGGCDDDAARDVVYDAAGQPMYAGQAMLVDSCGGGGAYCHASSAHDRYGVPAGLDFAALPLAVPAGFIDDRGLRDLVATQERIHRMRNAIWASVTSGSMPPGAVGRETEAHQHGWVVDPSNVSMDRPLPALDSPDGRALLRNWLACGAPIVERYTPYALASCTSGVVCPSGRCEGGRCEPAGDVVPRLTRPIEPTWTAIFTQVIEPGCTRATCHAPDPARGRPAAAGLDLTESGAARLALVGTPASEDRAAGAECGGAGRIRVVPNDPDGSLLVAKLGDAPPCGDAMPFGVPVDPVYVDAVRAWIEAGAPE